ncbi:MAG: hypothetical protein ACPGN3_13440 [Opitutales bacterium]
MTTKTSQGKSSNPRRAFQYVAIPAIIAVLALTGCGLKKSDNVESETEILIKNGFPLPEILHGTWTLDTDASKEIIEDIAQNETELTQLFKELENAAGSSMIIDAETWISKTLKGEQTLEAAMLSEPGAPSMTIGLDAYKFLVTLTILELEPNRLRLSSQTNPVMQMFVWRKTQ